MRKIKVKDLGREILISDDHGNLLFLGKENIKIMVDQENRKTVSWYFHDVFKKLDHVFFTIEESRNVFYLESEKLIDKTKLKKLVKSQDFKNKRFAFFNYGLALSLTK
jgi:predicted metallo-beta-lactamase superfamily hydrolase